MEWSQRNLELSASMPQATQLMPQIVHSRCVVLAPFRILYWTFNDHLSSYIDYAITSPAALGIMGQRRPLCCSEAGRATETELTRSEP